MNREWAVFSAVATVAILAIGLVVVGASQGLFGFASASSGTGGVELQRVVGDTSDLTIEAAPREPVARAPQRNQPQASTAAAERTTYQMGDAGLVTLEIRDGRLVVADV